MEKVEDCPNIKKWHEGRQTLPTLNTYGPALTIGRDTKKGKVEACPNIKKGHGGRHTMLTLNHLSPT